MTILQRIELHKQGYTKEEINALAAEEREAATPPAQPLGHPEQPLGHPAQPLGHPEQPLGHPEQPLGHPEQPLGPQAQTMAELLNAVKRLEDVVIAQNINRTPQQQVTPPETTTDIFNNILGGN